MQKASKILFNLYISSCILYYVIDVNSFTFLSIRTIQICGLLLFISELVSLLKYKDYNTIVLIYFILITLLIGSFFSGLYQEKYFNFLIIFNITGFIGSGLFFSKSKERLMIINALCLFILFYLAYNIYSMNNAMHWMKHSQNHVSVVVISLISLYYLNGRSYEKEYLTTFPALVSFIFCLFAVGRSGIICSFLILVSVLLINLIKVKDIKSLSFFIMFISISAFFINKYYLYLTLGLSIFSKLIAFFSSHFKF